MNLLEEILDSLNTTTVEQGKLSAAKSLDFFRSMDDLDYKAPVCKRDRGRLDYEKACHHVQIQDLRKEGRCVTERVYVNKYRSRQVCEDILMDRGWMGTDKQS